MRKYIIIALALVAGIAFISCDEYDYKSPEQTLFVVEADLDFPAQASEGKVVVEAPGSVTATSSETWCDVSVSGKTITVKADANPDFTNRTALVVIKYGEETQQVPVTQASTLFVIENNSLSITWRQGTYNVAILDTSYPVSVSSNVSWLSAKVEDQTIIIDAQENPLGIARVGEISVESGPLTQTISVNQILQPISYAAILGQWKFDALDFDGNPVSGTLTFEERVENVSFSVKGLPILPNSVFPINFNVNTGGLNIPMGSQVGYAGSNIVILVAIDLTQLTINPSSSLSYSGFWSFENNAHVYTFRDTGAWLDSDGKPYFMDGIALGGYTSSGQFTGNVYEAYTDWVLTKL